jgi:tRNA A-37 threonylcarbamoyl transferase component Bud32
MSDADRVDQIIADYLAAVDSGQEPDRSALLAGYPELADELRAFFADADRLDRIASPNATVAFEQGASAQPTTLARSDTPAGSEAPLGRVRYIGDYELLDEIARGGMGVVYKARQVSLNRIVALKMILTGRLASPADVQRFRTEAEAAANLEHPNIVPIYEVGEWEGQQYFSMGYVEGGSLADRIATGPFTPNEAAQLLKPLAEAVQFAHDRGVIHRDLKPSNVLIDGAGRPKLTDFGLAKRVQKTDGPTMTGDILGTPAYMPPEQAGGPPALVGPLADVYSLGALLYACLTGRPPFQCSNTLDTLMSVLTDDPTRPSKLNTKVPHDLETICLKCLDKRPERRYGSARELADELGRFLAGEPIVARRAGRVRRSAAWLRRRPWAVSGIAALGMLLVACLAYGLWAEIRERGWKILVLRAQVARLSTPPAHDQALELLQQAADIRPDQRLYEDALPLLATAEAGPRTVFPRPGVTEGEAHLPEVAPLPAVNLSKQLYAATWDRTGKQLIFSGAEIDVTTGVCSPLAVEGVGSAVVVSTGKTLAAVSPGGQNVVLVDRASGRRRVIEGWVHGLANLRFSSDGRRLALIRSPEGNDVNQLELWDLIGDQPPVIVAKPAREPWRIGFSADGNRLAWWHDRCEIVTVADTATGRTVTTVPLPADTLSLADLALNPDGSELAWSKERWRSGHISNVTVQDVKTGAVVRYLDATGWSIWINDLAYTPDARFVIGHEWGSIADRTTASFGQFVSVSRVLIWEAATGELVLWLNGESAAEGIGAAGDLAIIRREGESNKLRIDVVKPAALAARVAEAGFGPSLRCPDFDPLLRVAPFRLIFGLPTLLAFLAFVTVNVSSLLRYGAGQAMPPALARVATLVGCLAVGWGLVRLLATFQLPDWRWEEIGMAALCSIPAVMMGTNAGWYGLRNLHSALRGENKPVIRPAGTMPEIDRLGAWGMRMVPVVWVGWLLFVFVAGLDGTVSQFGFGAVLLIGAIAGFVFVTFVLVPLAIVALPTMRWFSAKFSRLRASLGGPKVTLTTWTVLALISGIYVAIDVWERVTTQAWQRLPAWHWGLEFVVEVRRETLGTLLFTMAIFVLAQSLMRVRQC